MEYNETNDYYYVYVVRYCEGDTLVQSQYLHSQVYLATHCGALPNWLSVAAPLLVYR